jgi:CDGSH-type Zn-finger protein
VNKPTISGVLPTVMELDAGTHYWCSCGQSSNQPFCDGSHQGSAFQPVVFTLEKKKKVALCNCKFTASAPFCNGAHQAL